VRRDLYLALPFFDHNHRFSAGLVIRQGEQVQSLASIIARFSVASPITGSSTGSGRIVDLFGMMWLLRPREIAGITEVKAPPADARRHARAQRRRTHDNLRGTATRADDAPSLARARADAADPRRRGSSGLAQSLRARPIVITAQMARYQPRGYFLLAHVAASLLFRAAPPCWVSSPA